MKKFYFSLLSLVVLTFGISMSAFSQEKVENKINDSYDRSSISVVFVQHGNPYEQDFYDAIQPFFEGKFDKNYIPTTRITVPVGEGEDFKEKLDQKVNELNLGKEIVSYWFNRKADGTMDSKRFEERGMYNADDSDVIKAAASKVGSAIADGGDQLIKNSYVVVFDGLIEKKTKTDKKTGKTSTYFASNVNAYVYHIEFDEDMLQDIYNNMWIWEDDKADAKAAKNKLYNDLVIPMTRVAETSNTGTDSGGSSLFGGEKREPQPGPSVTAAYNGILRKLENKLPDWQVKVPVYTVHPITAKIGTKEGVKNGSRFKVLKYVEDEDGNLTMKKRGFVRATTVVKNDTIATGHTDPSRFYQIAGLSAEEGMLLRQANDLKIGVSAAPEIGGLGMFDINIDYLLRINDKGFCHYPMLDFGFDICDVEHFEENYSYLNLAIGYGLGVPLTRMFEIRPSVSVGMDYILHNSEGESDSQSARYSALYANAALRFSWQVYYPFRIYAQADYSFLFNKGDLYEYLNGKPTVFGISDERGGLGFSVGLRYAF